MQSFIILSSWFTHNKVLYLGADHLPALTADNVIKVCVDAGVRWTEELCALLCIPWSVVVKIREAKQCSHDRLVMSVQYWLSVDHAPSWRRIVAAVDYWNQYYTMALKLYEFVGPITGKHFPCTLCVLVGCVLITK